MLVAGFPAGAFATNCFVVAPEPGAECVIVDPGQDAVEGVDELLDRHRLEPVAVVLTHGHLDHVWSVLPLCGARDVPAYIHPDDRVLLSDPAKGFPPQVTEQLLGGGLRFGEPDDVRPLTHGASVPLAGLEFTVDHAPGHTPGSVVFRLPSDRSEQGEQGGAQTILGGDLLFAGSIGRTDLPGGDHAAMLDSLARVCLPLPDQTRVLPGHGPETTIGRERATNPFLLQLTGDTLKEGPS